MSEGWAVRVGGKALSRLRHWDPSLRIELSERVAEMAESPFSFLTRAGGGELAGLRVLRYESEVIAGLTVIAYFDGFDDDPPRPVLVAITDHMDE